MALTAEIYEFYTTEGRKTDPVIILSEGQKALWNVIVKDGRIWVYTMLGMISLEIPYSRSPPDWNEVAQLVEGAVDELEAERQLEDSHMVQITITEKLEKILHSSDYFLDGLNYEVDRQEYEDEAWRCALVDGAVKEEDRPNVNFIMTPSAPGE